MRIAPAPRLATLGRLDHRVATAPGVRGGVLRLRRVAASDVPACQARPKVDDRPVAGDVVLTGVRRADVASRRVDQVLTGFGPVGRPARADQPLELSQRLVAALVIPARAGP